MILILLIIAVVLVLLFIALYNRLVKLRNNRENAFADIDVQLKQRLDLIPQLVEAVKGYMKHEKGIMDSVSEARKALIGAKGIDKKLKADNALEGALGRLFAIAENYPNLKANENFLGLQTELSSIEEKIAYARQAYNDSIMGFDNAVQTFPGNVFAGAKFKSQAGQYIKIPEADRAPVKVSF